MAIANNAAAKCIINVFGPEKGTRRQISLLRRRRKHRFRRLIQMGIIMYVVLYALMLQKGYQESKGGNSTRNLLPPWYIVNTQITVLPRVLRFPPTPTVC